MKLLALFVCSLVASVILLSISITTTITIGEQKQHQQQEQNFAYAASSSLIPDFNFAAAGDWGCTDHTEETVNNILDKSPELVLALGDYAYGGDSVDCWFEIIQPIDGITKIVLGNHDDAEEIEELMKHFGLTEQYYSFDYQNVHFIALATEEEYLDVSNDKAKEQLAFVKNDLEQASNNPNIDWIIPFYHRIMYARSGAGVVDAYDHNLEDIYHPLFEKYGVHLILQAHTHTYERTYPLKTDPAEENNEDPIITSEDLSNYSNIDGLVIATIGTGGATPTVLSTDSEYRAVDFTDLYGFLNVEVSSDGNTLVGTFYDNDDGEIKDKFTITKSSIPTAATADNNYDEDQTKVEEEKSNGDNIELSIDGDRRDVGNGIQ
jgi:hypothetical protein